jgi:iron complex transport system substrate-binding protein
MARNSNPPLLLRRSSALIGGFTAFCITASAAASISLKDDLGRTVELKQPAQRIVALAPFLTELVFSAGAGDRVVGVSAYSDYPPEAAKLPRVSSAAGFSLEAIAALEPDLVVVWRDSARREELERLAAFGAAVFVADARTLEDVPRVLRDIATLAGRDVEPVIAAYEGKLAQLRREHAGERRVGALLEIWHRPLTTIAGRHFMNEALGICGARNVFEDLEGVAPVVSMEEVYKRNPEIIVSASSAVSEGEFHAQWREHPTLSAVRSGKLVFVEPDRIQRLTARTPDGIAALCAAIERVR